MIRTFNKLYSSLVTTRYVTQEDKFFCTRNNNDNNNNIIAIIPSIMLGFGLMDTIPSLRE